MCLKWLKLYNVIYFYVLYNNVIKVATKPSPGSLLFLELKLVSIEKAVQTVYKTYIFAYKLEN